MPIVLLLLVGAGVAYALSRDSGPAAPSLAASASGTWAPYTKVPPQEPGHYRLSESAGPIPDSAKAQVLSMLQAQLNAEAAQGIIASPTVYTSIPADWPAEDRDPNSIRVEWTQIKVMPPSDPSQLPPGVQAKMWKLT